MTYIVPKAKVQCLFLDSARLEQCVLVQQDLNQLEWGWAASAVTVEQDSFVAKTKILL